MFKLNNELFITLILSGLASIFEQYGLIWFLVICTLIIETSTYYMSIKAKNRKVQLNKKRTFKIISQIISLLVGLILDALENYLISHGDEELGITFNGSIPFGVIICVYIILTESINIIYNLNALGAHFPLIVINFLKNFKDKTNEKGCSSKEDQRISNTGKATKATKSDEVRNNKKHT